MDRPPLKRGRFLRIQRDPEPVVIPGKIPPELRKFIGKSYTSYRRVKLWVLQDGKCHWCGCDCILLEPMEKRARLPDKAATLDHLRSRYDPDRRARPANGEPRQVMACNACNFRRARDETEARPLELRHQDGKRHPSASDWST